MNEPDAAEIEVSRLQASGLSYREAWDLVIREERIRQERVERELMGEDPEFTQTAAEWSAGQVELALGSLADSHPFFFPERQSPF